MSDLFLEIRLRKNSKIYKENDIVLGLVIISNGTKTDAAHQGISLQFDGHVNLKLSSKSVGIFDSFYNSVKPMQLSNAVVDILKPGKVSPGKTEIPFEIPLKSKSSNRKLYETYHGVFVNIEYKLVLEMKRSLRRDIRKECEIMIEYSDPLENTIESELTEFTLNPNSSIHKTSKERERIPRFQINGNIKTKGPLTMPMTGNITVSFCEQAIKSIELQLLRVEMCGCAEGYSKDITEIQNIQITDGDPCRDLSIPIYMIYPRLFTCPNLITPNFKVEFEVNIIVIFDNDFMVQQTFPLELSRF